MNRKVCFIVTLCATTLFPALLAEAQTEAYTVGPGGGGRFPYVAMNPSDPTNLYLSCDMSSNFISTDGGSSFHQANMWANTQFFFTPLDANKTYAVADKFIYSSNDKGATWDYFYPSADKILGIWATQYDTSPYPRVDKTTDMPAQVLAGLTVSEKNAGMVYTIDASGNVYRADAGSLTKLVTLEGTTFPSNPYNCKMVESKGKLYIACTSGFYIVDLTTNAVNATLITNRCADLQKDANGGITVYMICDVVDNYFATKPYKSTNNAATWQDMSVGFDAAYLERFGAPKPDAAKVRFSRLSVSADGSVYALYAGIDWDRDGMVYTNNGGETWKVVLTTQLATVKSETKILDYGPIDEASNCLGWTGTGVSVKVCENNPNIVLMGNMADGYLTTDGGLNWHALASKKVKSGANDPSDPGTSFYTTKGVDPAGQEAMAFDPFDLNHIVTTWTDIGVFESFDGGKSWRKNFTGVQPRGNYEGWWYPSGELYQSSYAVDFDPANQGVYLVGWAGSQSVKVENFDRTTFAKNMYDGTNNYTGTVHRTTDGGSTWWRAMPEYRDNRPAGIDPAINSGLPNHALISALKYDPEGRKPADQQTVYVACRGGGIFKSTTGGLSWRAINNGITGVDAEYYSVRHITFSADNNRLYALFGPNDGDVHTLSGSVYYLDLTNDRNNETWQKLPTPELGHEGFVCMGSVSSLSQGTDGAIYITLRTRLDEWNYPTTNWSGAWVSTDNGANWTLMKDKTIYQRQIAVDTRNPKILYLSSGDGKVYVSFKGAATREDDWVESPHMKFFKPHYIWQDEADPNWFYVGTICGGTWRMPVPANEGAASEATGTPPISAYAYPNPVERGGNMTIETAFRNAKVEIYNLVGACLARVTLHENTRSLKMPNEPGIYIVKISTSAGEKTIKVVVK